MKMRENSGKDARQRICHGFISSKLILFFIAFLFWTDIIDQVQCEAHGRRGEFESREKQNAQSDRQPPPPGLEREAEPKKEPKPMRNSYFIGQWTSISGTTTSPRLDSCPCILKPGSKECMQYDSRYMATTVEEAILNFPDLQLQHVSGGAANSGIPINPDTQSSIDQQAAAESNIGPMPPPPDGFISPPPPMAPTENGVGSPMLTYNNSQVMKSKIGSGSGPDNTPSANSAPLPTGLCDSNMECFECSTVLLNRLNNAGLLQGDELDKVSKKFGVEASTRQTIQNNCAKYHFTRSAAAAQMAVVGTNANEANNSSDPELDALVQQLRQKGEKRWQEKQDKLAKENPTVYRNKRQSPVAAVKNNTAISTLGQQFKIDCTKRGDPVEQGSTFIGLCNVCWAWRKLPANYFPQYVNELICDTDTKCMSGFASCQQRQKSVDILQNTGTDASPIWKQVTISVANYCDCEVETGSSLHSFVAA